MGKENYFSPVEHVVLSLPVKVFIDAAAKNSILWQQKQELAATEAASIQHLSAKAVPERTPKLFGRRQVD